MRGMELTYYKESYLDRVFRKGGIQRSRKIAGLAWRNLISLLDLVSR